MDKMKSTDVSAKIFSKTDRRADATFELGQGKRLEFHLRYNGKTAWADAFVFEGAKMLKSMMWQFPFSRSAQPLHSLVQETRYMAEKALKPGWLTDFVRIAMSKTRLPAFFRGQVEAELKLVEACAFYGPEILELHKALEDDWSLGRTVEMDDSTLSEEFLEAKANLTRRGGSVGQRDYQNDDWEFYELERTVAAARRLLMLRREISRRDSVPAHEREAFSFEG